MKDDKPVNQQTSESVDQQPAVEQTSEPAETIQEATVEESTKSETDETSVNTSEVKSEENSNADTSEVERADESAPKSKKEDSGQARMTDQDGQENQDISPQDPTSQLPPPTPSTDNPNAKWYVVHTYSGHENKVAATLKQRIESEKLENKIFEVLVPMQDKIEIRGGKKTEVKEKIFPGYILVKMVLDDNTWLAVRTTQGVTSFVGMGNKPTPIPESEVQTIVRFTQIQQPTFKQIFVADDTVKIVDGPFAEFIGKVDSVDEEKGKVKVLVSIFGRETPVELDFLQVQKI